MSDIPAPGPLPAAHPRETAVDLAFADLSHYLARLRQTYTLTSAEYVLLLGRVMHATGCLLVRWERQEEPPDVT